MSGYKLVPMEPTAEMVEALKKRIAVTSRGGILNAGNALSDAIAAAPAVQGEPVATVAVTPNGSHAWIDLRAPWLPVGRHKLYAAPQPAEQQPISHDWDDQDKCRRCGDRDWYASSTCSPKQQPAPDAEGLVEALSALRGCIMETRGPDAHSALELADAALADYRKQGGDHEKF